MNHCFCEVADQLNNDLLLAEQQAMVYLELSSCEEPPKDREEGVLGYP